MAEPKQTLSPRVGGVSKPIDGGKLLRAERALTDHEKAWGKVESTKAGNYVVLVRLPDGTVEELATVAAVVPKGKVVTVAVRVYANLADESVNEIIDWDD